MADPLSPADRSALAAEQGAVNMTVGGVLVFEDSPALSESAIAERIDGRLHLIPRYRQRLRSVAPGVTNPAWSDDTGFDLGWHLRTAHLDPPGNAAQLGDLIGRDFSRRLDRDRPLWELTRVTGLEHGRTALVVKMHHALVDGVAAVDIGTMLLDPTPEPLEITDPGGPWSPQSYDRVRHLAKIAGEPTATAQRFLRSSVSRAVAATDPRRGLGDVRRASDLVVELARQRPQAPMTLLNESLSANRRFAMVRADLAGVKEAGTASGGTINDTILGLVTAMLRRYFALAEVTLPIPPVALVPVSVRADGEDGGNRISAVMVDLPIDAPTPQARIWQIHTQMEKLKESSAVRAGALLVGASGVAPPIISSTVARAMGSVRAFNLVVSNIPGPQQPFYFNGVQLREVYPVVPLNPGSQRLNVGVLSYDGGVHFGLLADRTLEPGVEAAADCLREAVEELLAG
jgi:diacylglycerol O-acyltransferase / wax synthase